MAFVITDGKQTKDKGLYQDLDVASQGLKNKGVTIFGMGIGTEVEKVELAAMATSDDHVFEAEGFDILLDKVGSIKNDVCEGQSEPTTRCLACIVVCTKQDICVQ